MRVLVVGSCGKKKLHTSLKQPRCHDIDDKHDIRYWKHQFPQKCSPARHMYTGPQNTELAKAVDMLRTIPNVETYFAIISAGFGVLQDTELVPPYDCSFTTMRVSELRKRSSDLRIQQSIFQLMKEDFDLIYLALGKRYHLALGKDTLDSVRSTTLMFHGQDSNRMIRIPCDAKTVKAFSKQGHKIHGVVGFKGDLLRILSQYAIERGSPASEIEKWVNTSYLRNLVCQLGGL